MQKSILILSTCRILKYISKFTKKDYDNRFILCVPESEWQILWMAYSTVIICQWNSVIFSFNEEIF